MIVVSDLAALDPTAEWWVPSVTAPARGWAGAAGAHKGSRYLLDAESLRPARHGGFPAFESRGECLRWIMEHRLEAARGAPGARIEAVRLDLWMLGLDHA